MFETSIRNSEVLYDVPVTAKVQVFAVAYRKGQFRGMESLGWPFFVPGNSSASEYWIEPFF
jgi:hypothetical protein